MKLIDPSHSAIDPENHIGFIIKDVAIVYKELNRSIIGKNTIENLKFKTRSDIYSILRKIKIKIDKVFAEIVDALEVNNTVVSDSMLNDLKILTSAHQPHASFCRKYVIQKIEQFNRIDLAIINNHLGNHILPISIEIAKGAEVIK